MTTVIRALLPRGAHITVAPIENSGAREVTVTYATLPGFDRPTVHVDDDGGFGLPAVVLTDDQALVLAVALTNHNGLKVAL